MLSRRTWVAMVGGAPLAAACSPGRTAGSAGTPASPAGGGPGDFAALDGFCRDAAPIGAAEYEQRQERARQLLRDGGFAALIVESGPTLRYFAGDPWHRSERPLLLGLPVAGAPFFIAPAFEEGTLRDRLGGSPDLRLWQEHQDPYRLAVDALRERGVRTGRIAVEPTTRLFILTGLTRAGTGLTFENGASVVDACRMKKSAAELALLRRANQATKAALRAAADRVTPGMTEDQIRALIQGAQETAGLTDIWALVLSGPNAAFPHGTKNRRTVTEGDLILVDTGGALHGYQSDITRTWALGAVDETRRRAFETVRLAQATALKAIRPGTPCSDVDAAARKVVADRGFGDEYQRFTHRLGHGIGLEGHEHPYLVRGNQLRLEPGMTMSNEPGIYVSGEFGIRVEDIVAVTDGEPEVFGPRVQSLDAPFGE